MLRLSILLAYGITLLSLIALFRIAGAAGSEPEVIFPATPAVETVLYDGSLGTLPADQGMLYQATDTTAPAFTVEVVQSYAGDGARLDSTVDYQDVAGYSSGYAGSAPTLDRQRGVTIRFTAQITSEDHTTSGTADKNGDNIADRAGFSVIAISNDGQWGIELGFWEDQIWAQEGGVADLFTHAEGVSFNTTGLNQYELALLGQRYSLAVQGTPILSGTLRDYSAFGGMIDPYEIANFLFFGDDTSSASAEVKLTSIVVTDNQLTGSSKLYLPLVTIQ